MKTEPAKLPVHQILPFSNVEGEGNRTAIFVQGCNLRCLYCHNPETIPCKSPGMKWMTVEELLEEIQKNRPFIRGITVSGGEPTMYPEPLEALFVQVRKLGLTTFLDSNGFFEWGTVSGLIDQTDGFLFDVKGTGEGLSELVFASAIDPLKTKQREDRMWNNLDGLLERGKIVEVRHVMTKNSIDTEQLIGKLAEHLASHREVPLKLIRVHARGMANPSVLKNRIPSPSEFYEMGEFAKKLGLKIKMQS